MSYKYYNVLNNGINIPFLGVAALNNAYLSQWFV